MIRRIEPGARLSAAVVHDNLVYISGQVPDTLGASVATQTREILAKITQLSAQGAPFDRMPLSTLIEESVAPHRDFGISIKVRVAAGKASEPVGMRNPAILYGVGNILENAVDFAREQVEVNAWWNDDVVEIVISDDGPGIPQADMERVFEPFYRREPSRSRQTGGIGLGLAVVRSIARGHGGDVILLNRGGGGLIARVQLPL